MYVHQKMSSSHPYQTRQATSSGAVRYGDQFEGKSSLAGKSFCYDGTLNYNLIPSDIKNVTAHINFNIFLQNCQLKSYLQSKE